jgi:DNA-binding CsgD family transcriptional regulator
LNDEPPVFHSSLKPEHSGPIRRSPLICFDDVHKRAFRSFYTRAPGAGVTQGRNAAITWGRAELAVNLDSAVICALQTALLNRFPLGIVIVGQRSGVCFANDYAVRLCAIAAELTLGDSGLAAKDPQANAALASALAWAFAAAREAAPVEGPMTVALRRPPKSPLRVDILAVTDLAVPRDAAVDDHFAVLLVQDLDHRHAGLEDTLQAMFGLSPAEAALAAHVLDGLAPEQVAELRGVRLPTVRTQLQRIFAKTGTTRQPQLVALLGRLAAMSVSA